MKKIYSHHDRFMVWQIKGLLESHGIPCFIKNEFAIGGVGELSPFDSLPEVWISDDEWWPKTQQVISEFELQPQQNKDWYCAQCQEQNDANFEVCWQCGTDAKA
ncbi:putative signal transducing protein [Paraglaciecola hydrolytica]|uniref:RanBP2-type domain-containing protein n=1 Tax=Paraglaciecola hydrolytica TaxID=1799789 RepID=A0A148KM77_9ALTE|nr:DUF2007 domain-containing protein [Paraglaciecola hydrolytica]KXI27381.1 hypothetical protein AX660_21935 [Paraglaciecola hydrolytica]